MAGKEVFMERRESGLASPQRYCKSHQRRGRPDSGRAEQTTADRAGEKKQNWTEEELAEAQGRRADYHQLVALLERKFKRAAKNAGMSKSKIDAAVKEFQKAIRGAKKTGQDDWVDSGEYLKVRK